VRVNCEGKPHFIRRTFAEYYVEDYLVIRLTKGNSTSQQVHTFVLKYVFLEQYYHVIRIVIVELLSRSKPSKEVFKHYGNQVHDLGKYAVLILRKAVREGNSNIIEFLLDSMQAAEHTDPVNELLLENDEKGLTVWHWAVLSRNIQVSEILLEWAEKNLMADELQSELLARGCNGRNAWHWTAELVRVKVLLKQWEWAKRKLTTQEINNEILLATDNDRKTMAHASRHGECRPVTGAWGVG
jgi:hypothetical protein